MDRQHGRSWLCVTFSSGSLWNEYRTSEELLQSTAWPPEPKAQQNCSLCLAILICSHADTLGMNTNAEQSKLWENKGWTQTPRNCLICFHGSLYLDHHKLNMKAIKACSRHWWCTGWKKTTHAQWELNHCLLVSGETPALCYKKQQRNIPCSLLPVHLFCFPRCDSPSKWKRHSSVASQGISLSAVLLSADSHVRSLKLKLNPCC